MKIKPGWILVAIALMATAVIVGYCCGASAMRQVFKSEAVKAGHARYRVVDEFGQVIFEWLDQGDLPPKLDGK